MAKQYDGQDVTFLAGEDLSAKRYYIVKMSANGAVVACSAATDVPVGILQTGAPSGKEVLVRVIGHSKVVAGDGLSAGNVISTTNAGKAQAITVGTDTTRYILGIVTHGAGADGNVAECVILPTGRAA